MCVYNGAGVVVGGLGCVNGGGCGCGCKCQCGACTPPAAFRKARLARRRLVFFLISDRRSTPRSHRSLELLKFTLTTLIKTETNDGILCTRQTIAADCGRQKSPPLK